MKDCYKGDKSTVTLPEESLDFQIFTFTPSLFRNGLFLPGEKRSLRSILARLNFFLMTGGRAKVFYATREGILLHSSFVIPRCWKFPFLSERDYFIGPCVTFPKFRGMGIYPKVLGTIVNTLDDGDRTFYIAVDRDNKPSVRGIEKAGFFRIGSVRISKVFKRYHLQTNQSAPSGS